MKSNISVIVPVYNGQDFLSECLASIVSQQLSPMEIIVVDDGSTDDSASIVARFENITSYTTQNKGVAAARNFGIEKSSGKWIAFIDQDDTWSADSLEARMQWLEQNSGAEIVTGKQQWFLHGLSTAPSWVKEEQMETVLDGYLLGCALIDRKLFSMYGLFDESFRFSSDFDWFFRLKDDDIDFNQIDQVVLNKRIHSTNESRHAELLLKELARAIHRSIQRKRSQSVAKS